MVCDHLKHIRFFRTLHIGSTHDVRIFNESHLRVKLEENFDAQNPNILLGDQGFACSLVLITPLRADRIENDQQRKFNIAHKQTRFRIENP